jgi:hypothetical protein
MRLSRINASVASEQSGAKKFWAYRAGALKLGTEHGNHIIRCDDTGELLMFVHDRQS